MRINIDALSQQQVSNFKSAMNAYNNKSLTTSVSPPVLYIELTQNCVAKCEFCRDSTFVNNRSFNMSSEIFDILLRDYIPYSVMVDLRAKGESLILPNFSEYVQKVKQFGPDIRLTTTLGCGSKKNLQSLVDNDVYVSVSLDAADKDLYESIRKGMSYDIVIRNLEFLAEAMLKKHGNLKDRLRLGIVPLQGRNLDHVEKIIQLAERLKIEEIRLSPLLSGANDQNILKFHKQKTIDVLSKCTEYSRKAGIKFQLGYSPFDELYFEDNAFDLCCHPWLYVLIDYNGNFTFCDHIMGESLIKCSLGNVRDSKDKTWNGKKARKYRKSHVKKNHKVLPFPCNACYKNGRYADHESDLDQQFSKWLVTEKDIEKKLCGIKDSFF